MWREKVQRVIMGADAYEIVTREEPEPEGNTREGRTELRNWRKRRKPSSTWDAPMRFSRMQGHVRLSSAS